MRNRARGHRSRVVRWLAAAVTTGLLTACREAAPPPQASTTTSVDAAQAGTVTGTVRLEGTVPPAQMIRVDGDKSCARLVPGAARATERYVVGDNRALVNAFVYVKSGLEGRSFPVPDTPVVLNQDRCWYAPRVVGVRVGQPFHVLNSDPLLHNVRSASLVNEPFNQGQPVQGMRFTHTFSTEEVMVPFKCDVHAWMDAWVGVVSHPYFAVTGADGTFALPNLPPGTYTIEAWHEAAGTTTGTATVTARGSVSLDLSLAVPAS